MKPASEALRADPRHYQICMLGGLLTFGLLVLRIDVRMPVAVAILAAALGAQWATARLLGLPRFDPRSALISGLSLCLLLRTASPVLGALAAVLAIVSKPTIRFRGKHVFNPTNFALVVAMLSSDRVWVSPGQWGSAAWVAFLLAGLGSLVVRRAARSDVTWALLAAWAAVLFGRALWLGDPLAIPFHQIQNGAFLIFAFFMISDPKTTPDRRAGRVVFAVAVALLAGWIEFGLHRPHGLILALFALSPAVPLLDSLLRGVRYRWPGTAAPSPPHPHPIFEGARHA